MPLGQTAGAHRLVLALITHVTLEGYLTCVSQFNICKNGSVLLFQMRKHAQNSLVTWPAKLVAQSGLVVGLFELY